MKTGFLLKTTAAVTAAMIAAPLALAMTRADLAPAPSAEAPGLGRPMDDHGPDIAYGDLSVFDTITEIGEAQSPNVPYCDTRAAMRAVLAQDFGESARLTHPLEGRRSVELWASEAEGTWTALYTRADGVSCVVSSGIDWARGSDALALMEREALIPAG